MYTPIRVPTELWLWCDQSRYEYIGVKRHKTDVCYAKVFISAWRKQQALLLLTYALKGYLSYVWKRAMPALVSFLPTRSNQSQ